MTGRETGKDAAAPLRGAVAGLVAGVIAAFVMDRFQAAVIAASDGGGGDAPATEKAADAAAKAVTGRALAEEDKPFGGQAVHYALGAALGVAYGLAAEYRPAITVGKGTLFGAGVAGLLDEAAVPAVGLGSAPWDTSAATHAYTLVSHLVFGAAAEITRAAVRDTLERKPS